MPSRRTETPPEVEVEQPDIANTCVNCHERVESITALRLRVTTVDANDDSDVLWERPLCVECETSQPVRLLDYVKFALA